MTSNNPPDEDTVNNDPRAVGMAYTQGFVDGLRDAIRKNPKDTGPKPVLNAYKTKAKARR